MDEITTCLVCHVSVRPSDFFCYNCGHNLHPTPPSTTISTVITLCLGSMILPPMGFIWSIKYLKSQDSKARNIGLVLIGITVLVLVIATRYTITTYNAAMKQVNQIQNLQGF